MAIPTDLPVWDSNETRTVQPPSEVQEDGWTVSESGIPDNPSMEYDNWWKNNVYKWVERFDNVTSSIDTMVDLLSFPETVDGTTINVRGYNSANDGGGGQFNWDSSIDKSTANGITVIDPSVSIANQGTGIGFGCWDRVLQGSLSAKFAGVSSTATASENDGPLNDILDLARQSNSIIKEIYDIEPADLKVSEVLRKMQNGDTVTIVCMGDSITNGDGVDSATESYPVVLQSILRDTYNNSNITVINKGRSGNTAAGLLSNYDVDIIASNPDLVILMAGMNDLRLKTEEQYYLAMTKILLLNNLYGYATILCNITPRYRVDNDGYLQATSYRNILQGIAKSFKINMVDTYALMNGLYEGSMPYEMLDVSYDGVHYTVQGYRELAGCIFLSSGLSQGHGVKYENDEIECQSPLITTDYPADLVFSTGDAINKYRITYTRSVSGSSLTIRFWYAGKETCLLSGKFAVGVRETGTGVNATLTARNKEKQGTDGPAFMDSFLSQEVATAGEKRAYGVDFGLTFVKPGYNEIVVYPSSVGDEFITDGFKLIPFNPERLKNELYKPNAVGSYYEDFIVSPESIIGKGGIKRIQTGSAYNIGSIMKATPELMVPSLYAFYMQISDGTTKVHIGNRTENGTELEYLYTVEFTASGTTVDVNTYINFRDGTRELIDTELDIGNGYGAAVGNGEIMRIAIDTRDATNRVSLYMTTATHKLISTCISAAPIGDVVIENVDTAANNVSGLFTYTKDCAYNSGKFTGEEFIDEVNTRKGLVVANAFKYITYV